MSGSRGYEPGPGRPRVAYVMSRFPKLTETFVINEILAVERQGIDVDIYPLRRERGGAIHPGAAELMDRAHYIPFLSWEVVRSQLWYLARRPRRYLGALGALLRGTWGSPRFLLVGLVIFPKVAHGARVMAASGVRHVHCHFASHPAAAGFIVHRLTGLTFSFTAHGSDLHMDRHMLCDKIREAAFVVTISEFNRGVIAGECGSGRVAKVHVIHCGVDPAVFRPSDDARAERRTGPLTIVCIGTLHEVKGQTYLVEACRQLAERGMALTCELIGDGPDAPALRRQIERAGLTGRVLLRGRRSHEEIADRLRTADVLVAPSVPTREGRKEGIPMVLMEAMSSGLPVVASSISGIPELVDDGRTGLLVPPREPRSIADALWRLHNDPELRARLGGAARAAVRRDFDLDGNAARLVELLREVA